jgi:hypothetical protein
VAISRDDLGGDLADFRDGTAAPSLRGIVVVQVGTRLIVEELDKVHPSPSIPPVSPSSSPFFDGLRKDWL